MDATIGLSIDQDNEREYRTGTQLAEFVRRLEDNVEGLDALWVVDVPNHPVRQLEPMVALGAIAAATTRLRLGTGIVVSSHRNPLDLARLALAVDQLSDGRLLLGIGAGNATARSAGGFRKVPWAPRHEEMIRVIVALTSGQKVTSEGETWILEDAHAGMDPARDAVKILPSGVSPGALRRAARYGAGWVGSSASTTEQFGEQIRIIKAHLKEFGREDEPFTIVKRIAVGVMPEAEGYNAAAVHLPALGSPDDVIAEIVRLAQAGADHIVLDPVKYDRKHFSAIAHQVITPAAQALKAAGLAS